MNRLKELRKQQNITQGEMAKILNTTQTTYSKYESDMHEPNLDTLCKLADYYGVTLDYLIGRDYKNELGYINDSEKELLNNFRQLKPINQIKIIAEIKGILMVQN